MFIKDINNVIYAYGDNSNNQLGIDDIFNYEFRIVPLNINVNNIACGAHHTVIIDENCEIWVCGCNSHNQLGLNCDKCVKYFTKVPLKYAVIKASCGESHTVLIDNEGKLLIYGSNDCGQLGIGNFVEKILFKELPMKAKVIDISCGNNHTLILDENNKIFGCGFNHLGQLGLGESSAREINKFTEIKFDHTVTNIICGGNQTFIDSEGKIWGCGSNLHGQLGFDIDYPCVKNLNQVPINFTVTHLSSGINHTMIVDNSGNIWGCGENTHNQLGCLKGWRTFHFQHIPLHFKVTSVFCDILMSIIKDVHGNFWYFGIWGNHDKSENIRKLEIKNPVNSDNIEITEIYNQNNCVFNKNKRIKSARF